MARQQDKQFEKHFYWLASHNPEFIKRYSRIINPGTYENPEEAWFLEKCVEYYAKYEVPLTEEAFKLMLAARKESDRFDKDICQDLYYTPAPDEGTLPFLVDFGEDYLRRRQSQVVMQNYADALGDGDFEEIRDVLVAGLEDLSTSTTGDAETAIIATENPESAFDLITGQFLNDGLALPTGIKTLDEILQGGSRPGEMLVYLAPPGHGKSQWLTHVSREAWTRGYNVIYFSFEMAEPRIIQRFYAPIVKTPVNEIPTMSRDLFVKRVKKFRMVHGVESEFVVKRYPDSGANVQDIGAVLDHFSERGIDFDLVVADYADIVSPIKRTGQRRDDTNAVYKELRNLAVTRNVRLWTASQTNRLALRKKIITIEHLAEDFSKAMTADYIIAQAQTDDEKEVGEARLYMAKCRNNGQGAQILVDTDFAYARFRENTTGSRVGIDQEGERFCDAA